MTITALPTAPDQTQARSVFCATMAAWIGAIPVWTTQANALAVSMANDAATASAAATSLATIKWVSGTTYADGDVRWDPTTRTSFRRMGAGAGTTTPSADSINWKAQISLSNVWCGTATGTANALVLTPAIPSLAYVAGDSYRFKSSASGNTAATTVAISGLPAIAIQNGGGACVGGEILANLWYELLIDASLTSAQITPIQSVKMTATGGIAIEAVIAPTLLNSWVNDGGGYANAGYWKDAYGVVHLLGVIKSGTPPSVAFVLPTGYRPPATVLYSVTMNAGSGQVSIDTSGNVTIVTGSATYTGIGGITFRTT